jgi:hypothetical protein
VKDKKNLYFHREAAQAEGTERTKKGGKYMKVQ